ncbi:hypothetical protein Psch_04095 [Pelotomaculum schinkii]|uniref:Uncharacterized protein n=1 Tax=Pelotomaculum schinkii TaxID=78350 RepID=A0A4Y7R5W9_9FIRM|nr:hypothetical protein [Pelotomaculum schinkii]TEB04368.1 hypothetical protein Psch_04095 [Pelotomaculum schinkii]
MKANKHSQFVSISLEEFTKLHARNNPLDKPEQVRRLIIQAVKRKAAGAKCIHCGQPIWAIGSAFVGWNGCFTCITGEASCHDDYEIDEVCFI